MEPEKSAGILTKEFNVYIHGLPRMNLWRVYFPSECTAHVHNFESFYVELTGEDFRLPPLNPYYTKQPSRSDDDVSVKDITTPRRFDSDEYVLTGLFLSAVNNATYPNPTSVAIDVGLKIKDKFKSTLTTHSPLGPCTVFAAPHTEFNYPDLGLLCTPYDGKFNVYNGKTSDFDFTSKVIEIENAFKFSVRKNSTTMPAKTQVDVNNVIYNCCDIEPFKLKLDENNTYDIFCTGTVSNAKLAVEQVILAFDELLKDKYINKNRVLDDVFDWTHSWPLQISSGVRSLTHSEIKMLKTVRYTFSVKDDMYETVKHYYEQVGKDDFEDIEVDPFDDKKNESVHASIWLVKMAMYQRANYVLKESFNYDLHDLKNVCVRARGAGKFKIGITLGLMYAPRLVCGQDSDAIPILDEYVADLLVPEPVW